jgi:hypothetical protein
MSRPGETGCARREAIDGHASSADSPCEEAICPLAVEDGCVAVDCFVGQSAGGWSEPGHGTDPGPCR